MFISSVLATLLKSRFFVIYYRCVTLDGKAHIAYCKRDWGAFGCNQWFYMV